MNLFQHIINFLKQFKPFKRVRTPAEIAQKALQKWNEPMQALTHLLNAENPTTSTIEAACIIWGTIPSNEKREHIQSLGELLQRLPPSAREHALVVATNGDLFHMAGNLIGLASYKLEGLTPLALKIKREWDQQQRNDDLALTFYSIASAYDVSPYEAASSFVRICLARGDYERAEGALFAVFSANISLPSADLYWTFITVEQHLKRPPEQQMEALHSFTHLYSTDQRLGLAWQKIGDLYSNDMPDYQKVLTAYLHAEQRGVHIPQLQAYRAGNWEAIPALRTHPDALFPAIVALDLEVDPQPGAAKGTCIFEVAAVRLKGHTSLEQYHSYVQRDFTPTKWTQETASARLKNAPPAHAVSQKLRHFIGNAIVIGHNIRLFDVPELRGMGLSIPPEQIIDTLLLARLLHPDSLHHHLALLCQYYHIDVDQTMLHTAFTDVQACVQLFHALGDSLLQQHTRLLPGIRALVRPGSALDRAVLQPRQIPADPVLTWELDPTSVPSHILTPLRGNQASRAMQDALQDDGDCFVEHSDFDGSYAQFLPLQERSLVAVASRTRIEHMLAGQFQQRDVFVLPHPQTLLCSQSVRRAIEASSDEEERLTLFCLYQASHNHDAETLYPLRLPREPLDDPALLSLRQTLIATCCANEPEHEKDCPSRHAMEVALATHTLVLSTHKNLLARQTKLPGADRIVLDDLADLQMHLAEYSAYVLTSTRIQIWLGSLEGQRAYTRLDAGVRAFASAYVPEPGYRERLPLTSFLEYLEQHVSGGHQSLLKELKNVGRRGEQIANILSLYIARATQNPSSPEHFHAYWIDLWFAVDAQGATQLHQWSIEGLSEDVRSIFQQRCWNPYTKHILAGLTLTTGGANTQFMQRCLGISESLSFKRDPRTKKRVFLPTPETLSPSGFLQRRKWIMDVGCLLAERLQENHRTIMVTLNNTIAIDALLSTFLKTRATGGRQLLAPQLQWTMTKMNERLQDPERRVLVFAPPSLRQTLLASAVDLEISGPLRFFKKRDPVVAAQMHVFAHLYPQEGPFQAYLLPQALLELKSRLASDAKAFIICDGSLLSKSYRDDVLHVLRDDAEIQELVRANRPFPVAFLETLRDALAQRGLGNQTAFPDEELHLMLRNIWNTDTFRSFPPLEKTTKPAVTQKEIVRATLEKKDQLVVAATGGGKSLCFQLPAIILAEEAVPKVTLIFSPLIALMSNQVEQLRQKGIFSAILLNSSLSLEQRQEHLAGLKKGVYSIVYLAPEQIYSQKLRDALREREIGLVAIDEAHCLSQWGHNFRTDYFMLRKWIKKILCQNQKREFPILALTATARRGYKDAHDEELSDRASTVEDIVEKLELVLSEETLVLSTSTRRELAFHFEYITPSYTCHKCKYTYEYQVEVGSCPVCQFSPFVQRQEIKLAITILKKQRLLDLLRLDATQKNMSLPSLAARWSRSLGERQRGLIYCAYRKTTEEIAAYLQEHIPTLRISAYHAGMEAVKREEIAQRFISDGADGFDVIVSTNAFGMGIDVRRLGFVIHFDTPATPEAYYQEAGRAGRDRLFKEGAECAECILLFHPSDLEKQRFLSGKNTFSDYEIEDVYKAISKIYERNKQHPSLQESISDPLMSQPQAPDELQILASVQEIATYAGVEEESVDTLLYYLEEQTRDAVKKSRLLERGTVTNNVWRLKFEKEYLAEREKLLPSSPSWPVMDAFQQRDEYRLNTEYFTTISAQDFKDALHMSLKNLESEVLNLAKKHIIAYEGQGQFKLNVSVERLQEKLVNLGRDIKNLLRELNKPPRERLRRNEVVTENIGAIVNSQGLTTIPLAQFTHFLFLFSLEISEPLRLLECFKRSTRNRQPDTYELQLWLDRNKDSFRTIDGIIKQLQQTVEKLVLQIADQKDDYDWHLIDVFALELEYHERRDFHRNLQLLEALGLLKYISDPALGQAMHITLLQPPVPIEQLEIDLRSLRTQEKHASSKRKLMQEYVTQTPKEQYAEQFAQYFQGERPLIEQNQHMVRQDLTPQQREIVMLKEGIHVIEGPAGCGKTTTLAEHVKFLVNQQVPIDHIMITTCNHSAESHIGEALKELESEGEAAFCTTINAFGAKIFKQFRHTLLKPDGKPYYTQEPRILAEREGEEELEAINTALERCARLNFTDLVNHHGWLWPQGLEMPQFGVAYQSNSVEEERFQVAIHQLRQHGVFPTQPSGKEELTIMIGKQTGNAIAQIYAVYMVFTQVMVERNLHTFDDQIVFALAILRTKPEVAHDYQRYFEHVIVDELQDFSPAKVELLMILCQKRKNIMAFGDIEQEIGFEKNKKGEDAKVSADVVFSRLKEQESCGPARGHHLTINFRSTQEILDLCSHLRKYSGNAMLRSGLNKHGKKPLYLSTQTSMLEDLLDAILEQIEQLSDAEKESIMLIVGNKNMFYEAQRLLERRRIPFSMLDG